jgi:hypothetical protein
MVTYWTWKKEDGDSEVDEDDEVDLSSLPKKEDGNGKKYLTLLPKKRMTR